MTSQQPGGSQVVRLRGAVALVTGGGAGIGRATALRVAAEGASVVVADIDEPAAAQTAQDIEAAGGSAVGIGTDVADSGQVAAAVDRAVATYGRLTHVVNNAGVGIQGTAAEMDEDAWEQVMAVNLRGVWLGMKHAIPHLRAAGGGAVVNLASVQALIGFPGWSGYAATKGGIIALTQQAAVEYAPDGIRVNAVAPGTIMTPLNERILAGPGGRRQMDDWIAAHALGRPGQPEEVAAAIAFLLSDDASFVTGVCLPVDGGMRVNGRR